MSLTGLVGNMPFTDRMVVYLTTLGRTAPADKVSLNQQWAATAPLGTGKKEVQSGKYYEPVGVLTVPARAGTDDELAERLWEWTERELDRWVE